MKILLLSPKKYTLNMNLELGFLELNHEVKSIDYLEFFPNWRNRLIQKTGGLPERIIKYWYNPYLKDIQLNYLNAVNAYKPDLVIIYNDQLLLPDTIKQIKKTCPIFNYLGDNPFYIERRPFNVASMLECNHVFSPDTFWIEQIKQIGFKNISFLVIGAYIENDKKVYFDDENYKKYRCDLIMIGRTYRNSWGYKRALFYSKFLDLDIKIYGQGWNIWFEYFPELEKKYVKLEKAFSHETVKLLTQCAKIYPIDANPGLQYGLHLRIFDCIGLGTLPIVEYRKDLDLVFNNVDIPKIYDYNDANQLAQYYINNENERIEMINKLQNYIANNYTPRHAAEKIIEVYNSL